MENDEHMSGVHRNALMEARRVQLDAARLGFDWPTVEGPLNKIEEECRELRSAWSQSEFECVESELGDLLFSVVNAGRHLNIDPNEALNRATEKFRRRWMFVVRQIEESKKEIRELNLHELDAYWEAAKQVIDSHDEHKG